MAFVIWDNNRFAVNDVFYARDYPELRLSQLLSHGCKGGSALGIPDERRNIAISTHNCQSFTGSFVKQPGSSPHGQRTIIFKKLKDFGSS